MRGTASTTRDSAAWTDDDDGRGSDARRDAVRASARKGGRARRETTSMRRDETRRDEDGDETRRDEGGNEGGDEFV